MAKATNTIRRFDDETEEDTRSTKRSGKRSASERARTLSFKSARVAKGGK